MANLARYTQQLIDLDTFVIFDDFYQDQADTVFIDTVTDSGSVTMGDAQYGIAALVPSDGTVADNDEAYFACPNEVFLVAAGKPLYFRARVQFTEANTDDANVAVGFASAVAANLLVDNGAGLRASGNLFSIYKVDGETVWRCVSRNGTGVTTSTSTTTAGGSSYQVLEIEILDHDSVYVEVLFKVDGAYLKDSDGNVIRHRSLIASATEMQCFAAVKNGDTNLETLNVDYIYASQYRGR